MSVTGPAGFTASGVACGIKVSGDLDLALVATENGEPVPAAGVFTSNLAAAAPVVVSRRHLLETGGRAAAVIVSSGNANAATGTRGMEDAERICSLASRALSVKPSQVLLCQTGLIGIALPMPSIEKGIDPLVSARGSGQEEGSLAASAMMTTDTVRKEVLVEGAGFLVGGMAKGAAMLSPHMVSPRAGPDSSPATRPHATMLAVLTTDAVCDPLELSESLEAAVGSTFNRMSVDGCTSTNDTVLVLAGGRSGTTPDGGSLTEALATACSQLASMMVADAEGGTKVVTVVVKGAASEAEAHAAARKVSESSLVKCSLNGEDPYWGRVVSELGSAGVAFDIDRVEVAYGGIVVCRNGTASPHDSDALRQHMQQRSVEIVCDLGMGSSASRMLTCDLGHGYIDENRTTS